MDTFKKSLTSRKPLLLWGTWFFLANSIFFWTISFKYLMTPSFLQLSSSLAAGPVPDLTKLIWIWVFTFFSYLGHFPLLAFIPFIFIVLPLIVFFPKHHHQILPFSALLATFAIIVLLIDSHTFSLYRFHLNGTIIEMATSGHAKEIFNLSRFEWTATFFISITLFLLQLSLAYFIWHRIRHKRIGGKWLKSISAVLLTCLSVSYLTFVIAIMNGSTLFNKQAASLPLYSNILALFTPIKDNIILVTQSGKIQQLSRKQSNAPLNYPLKPLQCTAKTKPYNIIFIGVDAWRFDAINKQLTPQMQRFADQSQNFTKHFSGGNATQPGIFSLFYSLPSTYWNSTLLQKRGPVFIKELLKQHYQIGIFASANLHMPAFDKTVFQDIKEFDSITPGEYPDDRDRYITNSFKKFVAKTTQNPEPFFAFLFYDAAHGYCTPQNYAQPYKPVIEPCNRLALSNESDPTPYLNRYKNAVRFVDSEIGKVLNTLKQRQLLENSIIILTGDHGQEFNDNKLNYWEHASNYTPYQIQVPFILHWPNKKAATINYQTSHYDVVPTLVQQALGCTNTFSDYSTGINLFNNSPRRYLIAGSYTNFGIVQTDRITTLSETGSIEIDDLTGRSLVNSSPRVPIIKRVLKEMRKFYHD